MHTKHRVLLHAKRVCRKYILIDLLKNIEEKEKDINIYFDGVKLKVSKCLESQVEKKSRFEKDLKRMSDDLILERQKSKEYYEQVY